MPAMHNITTEMFVQFEDEYGETRIAAVTMVAGCILFLADADGDYERDISEVTLV